MYRILAFILMLSPIAGFGGPKGNPPADSTVKSPVAKLSAYFNSHIAEQAYLHFDKPYYAAGDTVYFKAYIVQGEQRRLSGISGVLHIDLIGPGNTVEQSLKLQIVNGVTWGDIALPDSLVPGNYLLRAYTRWMLNYGPDSYFEKVLPVGSLQAAKTPGAAANQTGSINIPDIQFFPEGGTLVTGIRSKVAFKAIGGDGLGINVSGEVVDNDNKPVLSFASSHLGMGEFLFVPQKGKTYTAKLSYPGGQSAAVALPRADTAGIGLSVDNSTDTVLITLAANREFYQDNKNKIFPVIIYTGGEAFTFNPRLDVPIIAFTVPKRALHTGAARITLFSPGGIPLCERLIFVQNNDGLNITLSSDKPVYAKRGQVNLSVNVKDAAGKPVTGHFSVAVIDESKVPVDENNERTILTGLLLTGDLKGYVEQPNYYFLNENAKTNADLDLVMLTHGYRRFGWKEILNGSYPPITLQPEKGISISGAVKTAGGNPIGGASVYLFPMTAGAGMQVQKTDSGGIFKFDNLIFTNAVRFEIKAQSNETKNTAISYDHDRPMPVTPYNGPLIRQADVNSMMPVYLANAQKQQEETANHGPLKKVVLKNVDVKNKGYESSNIGGSGYADQVLRRQDFKNFGGGSFSDVFNHRLTGVKFVGDEGQKVAYLEMQRSLEKTTTPMLVVIDGVKYDSGASIDEDVDVSDIETIEVLTSSTASIYGMDGAAGVLVITTRRGSDNDSDTASVTTQGLLNITSKGFYQARVFYSPKYDHAATGITRPDLRSTVYWAPEVMTDKNGAASLSYYDNDGAGSFRVVIEGIDGNGDIGRQVYRYKAQ